MRESALFKPLRWKFTEAADVERFGDGWHRYDEAAIVRLPPRDLIEFEAQIGSPIPQIIREFRLDSTLGLLAATWIALRLEDPELAGKWDDYSPIVHLTDWEYVPPEEISEVPGPLEPTPSTSSTATPPEE